MYIVGEEVGSRVCGVGLGVVCVFGRVLGVECVGGLVVEWGRV